MKRRAREPDYAIALTAPPHFMNRAQKRLLMRKIPNYKDVLRDSSKKAVDELEKLMSLKWDRRDDQTLNDGDKGGQKDGRDDVDNL